MDQIGKKTILLVDDEDFVRDMLARAIERRGVIVFKAALGQEAIDVYREKKPLCVFLDVKLPDIEGPEVLQKIKEFDPDAKVYFITGLQNQDILKKTRGLDSKGVLEKPVTVSDIMKIIESA